DPLVTGVQTCALPILHLRDTYPVETAWAPQWAGDELRQVRGGAREARLAAARASAEAAAARRSGHHEAAARHEALAASYQAMERSEERRVGKEGRCRR